jgi:hypothetical protein
MLRSGDELSTKEGKAKIESIKSVSGAHRVYNIEVEQSHQYLVSAQRLLTHNGCPTTSTGNTGAGLPTITQTVKMEKPIGSIADDILDWLGPRSVLEKPPGGSDILMHSADRLLQIRFDLTNPHGDLPHINLEVFAPRNKYPGDRKFEYLINEHIYPRP